MIKLIENNKGCKVDLADLQDYPTTGIHHHHMKLANYCKGRGASEIETLELLNSKFHQRSQRRPLSNREIENAVTKTYQSGNRLSFKSTGNQVFIQTRFEKTSSESFWNTSMPMPKVEADRSAVRKAIKSSPWHLEDMYEDSPLEVSECSSAEILRLIFDEDELVCSGSVSSFKTLSMGVWRNEELGEQVVPNPSRVRIGTNMNGNPSAHCRDATGERKYIVVESDDESIRLDDKASLIRFLRDQVGAELRMVVHSGGKSLHAWFCSSGDPQIDWHFMQLACRLGADPRMWLPEQLARTPNAVRSKNQQVQKCLYIDPR